jgi:hypothetical protein
MCVPATVSTTQLKKHWAAQVTSKGLMGAETPLAASMRTLMLMLMLLQTEMLMLMPMPMLLRMLLQMQMLVLMPTEAVTPSVIRATARWTVKTGAGCAR